MRLWQTILGTALVGGLMAGGAQASSVTHMTTGPSARLVNSSPQQDGVLGGEIRIEFPALSLQPLRENGQSFLHATMDGCGLVDRPGLPELPSWSRLVEIPDRSDVRFELIEEDVEYLELDQPLYPQQDRVVDTSRELPMPFLQDDSWQAQPSFPAEGFVHGEPALVRNHRVVKLTVFPVRVVDGGQRLRIVRSMSVRPVFEGSNPVNTRDYRIARADSPFSRTIENLMVNASSNSNQNQREIFDQTPEPGTYLIIARNATITNDPYFIQFVNWKREKGHKVYIAGESEIGGWSNSDILAYTQNAYQNWADTPDYLLLIGDTGTADAYQLPGGAGDTYSGEQDHYYAKLEGNDILGDIAVGRISVSNSTQLANVLNKVLLYERNPGGQANNTEWLSRSALATGYDANSMIQLSRSIAQAQIAQGFTSIDSSWYPSTNSTWVEQVYNSGINFYNYRGWIGMNGVSATWVDSHFSNVGHPTVSVIFTCATGDFNNGYATTEAFLRNGSVPSPKGGVCALGFSTANTHTAYNNAIVGGFWNGALEYAFPEVGVSLFMGKVTLYLTMPPGDSNPENFANWANLMGDPGLYLWLGQPDPLTVTHSSVLASGQSHLTVTVLSEGHVLADAVVCVTLPNGSFQSRVLTDSNGQALVPLAGMGAGTPRLTVSKANHLVYQSDLSVGTSAAWAEVSDPGIPGDGLATPGESLNLLPVLQNTGNATTLTGLSAVVSVDGAYGTLSDNTISWPSVNAGSSAAASSGCVLQLNADLADGTIVPLQLTISSGQGSFSDVVEVPVSAPFLMNTGLSFLPGGSQIGPGQSASMSVDLGNMGNLPASGMAYTLSSADPFVSVTQATDTGGSLPVGGTQTVQFEIQADNGAFGGYLAQLSLDWTANGVIQGSIPLTVPVGVATAESPTGPDSYGYRVYEDTDSNTESPIFNWIPLAPEEGGSGTALAINDFGDEQDDAVRLTLPFSFRYYGVDHTYLAVCSNGFAAFGENAHVETDYRNHYLPTGLGPDNMLAVMWDDMLLGSGAAVYSQYFPAEHKYVVEWYNMRFNNDNGARNTFQLILFDPAFHPTATGDGEFVYQYLDFINTQSHSYDFPYCTIGIKNGNSTDGLTVSNFNLHPASIAGINDAKALKFTTDLGSYSDEDLAPPVIIHVPPAVSYSGQPIPISASITDNHGVANATIHWDAGNGSIGESMGNLSGDTWSGFIPAQLSGSVIHYYLTATDVSDNANVATSPTWTLNVYDIIFEEPFEGTSSFSHEAFGGGGDEWHLESARSHAGSSSMKFGGAGTAEYSASGAGWLTSSPIAIPAGASNLQLSFWSWIDGETSGLYPDSCYDGGVVEFSLDGGLWQDAVLTPAYTHALRERSVVPLDFPRLMISGSADWTQYALDVPDGVGQVQLRFGFVSDTGTNREGWYVDEVRLSGQLPPTLDGVTDLHIVYGANTAVLSWSPVPDAIGYRIYSGTDPWAITGPFVAQVVDPFWVDAVGGTPRKFYLVTAIR